MSVRYLRRPSRLMTIWEVKHSLHAITVKMFSFLSKMYNLCIQHAKSLTEPLKLSHSTTEIDTSFEDLVDHVLATEFSLNDVRDVIYELRVKHIELVEINRALREENKVMRAHFGENFVD